MLKFQQYAIEYLEKQGITKHYRESIEEFLKGYVSCYFNFEDIVKRNLKMDKETKEQWVKQLRSGRYSQVTGFLRSVDNEFCCLGVLCDMAGVAAIKGARVYSYVFEKEEKEASVPTGFKGMYTDHIILAYSMNDDLNFTFEQIADVIEESF